MIAAKHQVPKIIHFWILRVIEIASMRGGDGCMGAACKIQKLIDLMAAEIIQNAAMLFAVICPIRAGSFSQLVRTKACCMYHLPDCAAMNQFACFHSGSAGKPFTKVNRVDTLRFGLHAPDLCQLFLRREGWLG